jgi:perosamine synthetase
VTWRRQLPAWSPVTARALVAGASAPRGGGRHTRLLADRVRTEYGAPAVELARSGTAALALAMLAASEGARPRVAMPAWGCYDLMTAADIVDAEVVLYDLDPATLAPARASFAGALGLRPTSVVVAHWFGLPISLTPLLALAHEAGALLIEDAAQGLGGMIGLRPLGSTGDFGILSFGRGKGRTGGCGGALLANTATAVGRLERVAHAVAPARGGRGGLIALAAQWAIGRPWLYAIPSSIPSLRLGETVYHPPTTISAMPEWAAAVVGAIWLRSALESAERRVAAARWAEVVAHSGGVKAYSEPAGTVAGWLRFPVRVTGSSALVGQDARNLGIMPAYPGILADLPVAPGRLAGPGAYPGATELGSSLRTLPTHSLVGPRDVAAIVQLLGRGDHHRS